MEIKRRILKQGVVPESEPTEAPAPPRAPARVEELQTRTVIPHDAANESLVIGIAALSTEKLEYMAKILLPDHFVAHENREAWACLMEVNRKRLTPCTAVYEVEAGADTAAHIEALNQVAASSGAYKNIDHHIQTLLWDAQRIKVATGSLSSLITAIKDPHAPPEKLRALAQSFSSAFDTGFQDRKWIANPEELVRSQMADIRERVAGRKSFEYGVHALDWYQKDPNKMNVERKCIPGAAPGQITVVTGSSGAGKTTVTANIALGLIKKGRKVLYGAWEMSSGMSLEVITCIALGWPRSSLMEGIGKIATREGQMQFQDKMAEIANFMVFMNNPFRRRTGEKLSNQKNLDLLQSYIENVGPDVFIGDLWQRCLVDGSPEAEAEALVRQQAMAESTHCHCILIQQQRLKDVEQRTDKRPSRDGIKGSAAWVEVADTIIGVHRPALYKNIPDDKLELILLKQRYGKWPIGTEMDWNPTTGQISGGRDINLHEIRENEIDAAMPPRKYGNKKK